jgi:hypothetical protein
VLFDAGTVSAALLLERLEHRLHVHIRFVPPVRFASILAVIPPFDTLQDVLAALRILWQAARALRTSPWPGVLRWAVTALLWECSFFDDLLPWPLRMLMRFLRPARALLFANTGTSGA